MIPIDFLVFKHFWPLSKIFDVLTCLYCVLQKAFYTDL